jgi:hypothetical protein
VDKKARQELFKNISVTWSEPANEAASLAYRLFRRRVQERSGAVVEAGGSAGYALKLVLDPSLPGESFRIASNPGGAILSGADPLGLLYGIMIALIERNQARVTLEGRADLDEARQALTLARQVDARLPAWAQTAWRWRILYLRALLDVERYRAAAELGLPLHPGSDCGRLLQNSPAAQAALLELIRIYHFPDRCENEYHIRVRPPLK